MTANEILEALKAGEVKLPPLEISQAARSREQESSESNETWTRLSVRWNTRGYHFVAICRRLWTRRTVEEAAETARRMASTFGGEYPLVVVPYLSEEQLVQLERKQVSGIDLCGNGVVMIPGELLVWRTGLPNRFHWNAAIKNVYRKDSSLVGRVFLQKPRYESIQEALAEIALRGGRLTLGTVSKVCKSLEEDLIIARQRAGSAVAMRLSLLQPDKLLDRLNSAFVFPEVGKRFTGRVALEGENLLDAFRDWETTSRGRICKTGSGSVEAYAVMAREPIHPYYCTDITSLVRHLGESLRETDRFANLRLLQTSDQTAYFDCRKDLTSSPIQTYLELSNGEKREQQTAEQVRRIILNTLSRVTEDGS